MYLVNQCRWLRHLLHKSKMEDRGEIILKALPLSPISAGSGINIKRNRIWWKVLYMKENVSANVTFGDSFIRSEGAKHRRAQFVLRTLE